VHLLEQMKQAGRAGWLGSPDFVAQFTRYGATLS
jgi:hypothetical protein